MSELVLVRSDIPFEAGCVTSRVVKQEDTSAEYSIGICKTLFSSLSKKNYSFGEPPFFLERGRGENSCPLVCRICKIDFVRWIFEMWSEIVCFEAESVDLEKNDLIRVRSEKNGWLDSVCTILCVLELADWAKKSVFFGDIMRCHDWHYTDITKVLTNENWDTQYTCYVCKHLQVRVSICEIMVMSRMTSYWYYGSYFSRTKIEKHNIRVTYANTYRYVCLYT